MDKELAQYIASKKEIIEASLKQYFKDRHESESLLKAMEYSLFSECKRFRPILAIAACETVGGDIDAAKPFACGLELIHTYSLIHDDLPSMDDDDLRRGKPSNHKAFGEAKAVLAGDALLTMAFEIMSRPIKGLKSDIHLQIINSIARASGHNGMVGGQVLDIEGEKTKVSYEDLENIHLHKTGKLIQCAILTGAMVGGAHGEQLTSFENYGKGLGLAFQITDDILDFTNRIPGKNPGGDLKNNKSTFATLLGVEKSTELVNSTIDIAKDSLKIFGDSRKTLESLAEYIRARI